MPVAPLRSLTPRFFAPAETVWISIMLKTNRKIFTINNLQGFLP
jgi:hypothetical protein